MLYQLSNQITGYVIGIEPYEITFHFGLSDVIENKRNEIKEAVKGIIERLVK